MMLDGTSWLTGNLVLLLLLVRTITVVEVCGFVEGVVAAEVSIPHVVDDLVKHDKDVCSSNTCKEPG